MQIKILSLLCLLSLSLSAFAQDDKTSTAYVYAISYVGTDGEGIIFYKLNLNTGELNKISSTYGIQNPSYLTVDHTHQHLYVVIEDDNGGSVQAYSIDQSSGSLNYINEKVSSGGPVCVAVDHTNEIVLTAQYGAGTVTSFPVGQDGGLGDAGTVDQHSGSGPNPDRQEGPHAHFVTVDPGNKYALAVDLGTDSVYSYIINTDDGTLTRNVFDGEGSDGNYAAYKADPGAGPRHLIFHPTENFLYVVHELANTVVGLTYDPETGSTEKFQTISSLPSDFSGTSAAGAIKIRPDGRFLYATNRGYNTVVVFAVDQNSGELSVVQFISTEGDSPRDMDIDPTGKVLLLGNEHNNNLVTYLIDADTGILTLSGFQAEIENPQCVKAVTNFVQGDDQVIV